MEPQVPFAVEDLLGAWECFQGDGIHDWDRRVLVFRREGGRMLIDYWLPKGESPDAKRFLWGTFSGDYTPAEGGLLFNGTAVRRGTWFRRDEREGRIHVAPAAEAGAIFVTRPGTTAGGLFLRRTTWPRAKKP